LSIADVSNAASQPSETASFERSLAELEAIVHDLEDGQLGLADALARYEQGVKHLKHCYALLTQAEQKIELLTGVTAAGEALAEPFVEADDGAAAPTKAPSRRRAKSKLPDPPSGEDLAGLGRDIDDEAGSI
jgi:exodeoxyribonuclease VII small subunit